MSTNPNTVAVCDHDDTEYDPHSGTRCLDCGADLDADGPDNDDWIARAYEAQADAAAHRRAHDPHTARPGDRNTHIAAVAGDMVIRQAAGCETVSNRYDDWEVVPPDERTRAERVRSLLYEEPGTDDDGNTPEDETLAWRAVYELALLVGVDPLDVIDWPSTVPELVAEIAYALDRVDGTRS